MTSLAPALLLSMPQLLDPNFNRTVVLLCKHSDEGAFGLVVNRPLVTTGRVVVNLDPPVSDRARARGLDRRAGRAAAQLDAGRAEPPSHTKRRRCAIADGCTCPRRRTCCAGCSNPIRPTHARLIVGYAGWGPGQLEAELEESAWLLSDVDRSLIFDTPPEQMWETAIRRLGADPAALTMSRGVH